MIVDLKIAFDCENREELLRIFRKNNVDNEIIHKVMKIFCETSSTIKINNQESGKFWQEKGDRQ